MTMDAAETEDHRQEEKIRNIHDGMHIDTEKRRRRQFERHARNQQRGTDDQ